MCVFVRVCVFVCGGMGCRCLDSRRHLKTLPGHTDAVMCLASSGGKIFSGSWDATVRVWDARSLTCISILDHCRGPVVSIAPMRTSCIAVGVDFIHILPMHTPESRHVDATDAPACDPSAADTHMDTHMDDMDAHIDTHMETSCDSEGSASQQRGLRKLDTVARSDAVVSVAVGAGPIARGKQGVSTTLPALSASTFLPEFRMLTGHKSGVIRAWNTSTWACELELRGHEDAVTTLAVWGSCLVSGAADGTVRLWDLGVPDSVENASVQCTSVVKIQSEVVSLQVHDPRALPQTGAGAWGASLRAEGAEGGYGRDGGAFILCGAKDRTVRVLATSVLGRQPSQLG